MRVRTWKRRLPSRIFIFRERSAHSGAVGLGHPRQISIFVTETEHHPNDCDLAIGILVNQMRFEWKTLSLVSMLRGAVDVEMQELESLASNSHEAARFGIPLNGMAVVDP